MKEKFSGPNLQRLWSKQRNHMHINAIHSASNTSHLFVKRKFFLDRGEHRLFDAVILMILCKCVLSISHRLSSVHRPLYRFESMPNVIIAWSNAHFASNDWTASILFFTISIWIRNGILITKLMPNHLVQAIRCVNAIKIIFFLFFKREFIWPCGQQIWFWFEIPVQNYNTNM